MLFEFGGLDEHVTAWLLSLSERDLRKLANATPDVCESIACGVEPSIFGLAGVPKCEKEKVAAREQEFELREPHTLHELLREPGALATRLRRVKGLEAGTDCLSAYLP